MTVTITRNPNLTAPLRENNLKNSVQQKFGQSWWTGLSPEACCGFDRDYQCLRALPLLNFQVASRQDVLDYFNNTWTLTELLFQSLKSEDTYIRPPYHQLRHPLIFYYGHTAVLFVNKLRLAGLVEKPIDLYLEKVLETGVDEMSWDDLSKNEMIWPTVAEVHAYRKKVYNLVRNLILSHADLDSISKNQMDHPLWALWMGFEHEKIHFETSSVLIRELPVELVETPRYWAPLHSSSQSQKNLFPKMGDDFSELTWIQNKAQTVVLGKSETEKSFGWDNEYGFRKIELKEFQVSKTMVTNGEYFEFVKSGDYCLDEFWTAEGMQWRKFRNTKRPTFWMASGPEGLHEYKLRTVFEVIAMPWDWPVEVNHHEAKAYCQWKQKKDNSKLKYRLLTEGEFASQQKYNGDPVLQQTSYSAPQSISEINFNFHWSSPTPVDETPCGNVWHLLEDQFNPLTHFKVHSLYDDFSTPCFDGKHNMIAGGSFISCGHEASRWARFHFRPHFYQHSGFRIAATLDGSADNGSFKLNSSETYVHAKRASALDQMNKGPEWFKKIDQPLEPSPEILKNLFQATQDRILDFYSHYGDMKASGTAHDPQKNFVRDDFKVPYQVVKNFPRQPQHLSDQLKLIFEELAPLSQLPGHPGYAAYASGSANVYSNIAQLISQTLNPFTGHFMMAPGCVTLEAEAVNWFLNLFQFPEKTAIGYFTSGGSQANLAAISLARKNRLQSYDLSSGRVYCSDQAHHCIGKALDFLGFPKESLRKVPTTSLLKMDLSQLESQINADLAAGLKPFAVVGTAGTTNTGAVDELSELARIAQKYNLWFHVDGAYGALFMLTDAGKEILSGIERADSVVFDPHKTLCLPYGTGGLLIRDRKNIFYDFLSATSYMPPPPQADEFGIQVDYADLSVELSRDWRGLRVWLPIKTLGIEPFILNLEEKLQLTLWLQQRISEIPQLQVFQSAQLTVLSFFVAGSSQFDSNQKTQNLLEKINNSDRLFLSACEVNGQKIIRVCLLGHRLHFERIEQFVQQLKEFMHEVN
ncbi:MAG: 5-histidylcysteine sulfoxide synthase [Bdellovibrionales bacterium RIFCSPHIGHO2_01_FULL_40_29]|nr:MAG: 5-histidylcysteine sulfoxide synthase [Bdellovibrionales bacterium RIFCSPHIGHO2_01_FULL_40_29]OFZ32890.1 MAG: 5-histidylcysteine sulfoxide synthase [Bdellovibrionales bacterium RIFCSPHIGHO2_02_FULL_40_15]